MCKRALKKTEFTIADEQLGQIQKRLGYEVKIAIPDWDKNRGHLDSVKKGYLAQQKLLAELQGKGASRRWMNQRFDEVGKTAAGSIATVAEKIETRRWREREHGGALQHLQDAHFATCSDGQSRLPVTASEPSNARTRSRSETTLDATRASAS